MAGTTKYEIKLMNVPFNNTYSDVILFDSVSDQTTAFTNLAQDSGKEYSNLNVIVKNGSFILKGKWDTFNSYNYMMYRYTDSGYAQNNHTSKWFYAFIDEVSYNSRIGTIIKHTLDVWQTYHTSVNFNKQTMIERGMVHTSDDTFGRWLAPEPLSVPATIEKEVKDSNNHPAFYDISFEPVLILDSLSKPTEYQGDIYENDIYFDGRLCEYQYGGYGSGYDASTCSGIYRYAVYTPREFFNLFNLPEKFVGTNPNSNKPLAIPVYQQNSHLTDIIKFSFVPSFLRTSTTREVLYNKDGVAIGEFWGSPENIYKTATMNISKSSGGLACGYSPHNIKMYTSLCRAFKIWNKNGLSIPIKSELLTSSHIKIGIDMNCYGDTLKLIIDDYNNLNKYFDIPYSYDIQFGYNANTGVAHASKEMQLLNQDFTRKYQGYMPYVNAGTELITGAGALTVGAYGAYENMQPSYMFTGNQSFNVGGSGQFSDISQGNLGAMGAGIGLIGKGFGDLAKADYNMRELTFDYSQSIVDTYASIGMSVGGTGTSRTNMTANFWTIRLADCSPLYDECVQIEDFLDRYGYTIKELLSLEYFIQTRKYWNFVKTNNCQLKTPSPNNDNVIFNNILNTGVTIWKNVTDVQNYNVFTKLGNYKSNNYNSTGKHTLSYYD